MGIAENIKRRRLELNISQQELANAMGYKSRSTIAKIEAGENDVPESKIPRFARVLGVPVEYIKTGIINESANKSIIHNMVINKGTNMHTMFMAYLNIKPIR